ncbi:MAG: Fur family transcriptional regulator [Acidimicrobiales bacterium]
MGTDLTETHDLVAVRLRSSGQIYTKGRRGLVELLVETARPATVAELLNLEPRLTQSSLYRNMTDLEAVGIIQRVVGSDELTRYELSEDIIGHHHHLICTQCGSVDDFEVPAQTERSLEAALTRAARESGFRPTGHRLDVLGICAACS